MLDSIDTLFAGIPNEAILRSELRRLFSWLKERELTTVITAERGEKSLTRHGIEEYVSDCVIVLDHRVIDDLSTRRLRVVKYRGTVARYKRVSVPDRRAWHIRAANHLTRAAPWCVRRTAVDGLS